MNTRCRCSVPLSLRGVVWLINGYVGTCKENWPCRDTVASHASLDLDTGT